MYTRFDTAVAYGNLVFQNELDLLTTQVTQLTDSRRVHSILAETAT